MIMIRKLLSLAAFLSLAALALGFTGRFLPLGDSLAVFRLPNIVVSSVLIFVLPKGRVFIGATALIIFGAASMAEYYLPQEMGAQKIGPQETLRLYQKNLLLRRKNRVHLTADILEANPDVITLQEIKTENSVMQKTKFITKLSVNYPHQLTCPFPRIGGVAVLSRRPILESNCFGRDGLAAIKVQTQKGPLWVISIHSYWPYPYNQAAQVKRAADNIKTLEGPKIIAGDFNMVPWSRSVKSIERASDTHIARPIIHSFDLPFIGLPIPIDHVLLPKGATAKTERRGKLGSDHFGVLVNFTLPAP